MASSSRSFNFGSDDVLGSYDDYTAQDSSNAKRSDPSAKVRPLVNIYEQEDHSKDDLVSTVEICMKKYADTLMRSLEGITGRLSQLEIHCYKLERSIGELRGDMIRGQSETDLKFKSLEKHMQEVHRSVQILRDKQELAEAQKELAKLQSIQKESTYQKQDETSTLSNPLRESTKHEDNPQITNQQLALVPARQSNAAPPPHQQIPLQVQHEPYTVNQSGTFYPQQTQPVQPVQPGYQYMQPRPAQLQEIPVQVQPTQVTQQQTQFVNPVQPQSSPFPSYQQQLQLPQPNIQQQQYPPQPIQPTPSQPQTRPQTQTLPPTYNPYQTAHQPSNPIPETYPPYSAAIPLSRSEIVRPNQGSFPPPPPHMTKSGYANVAPYPVQGNVQGFTSAGYSYPPGNVMHNQLGQQITRNHPYGEIIEKAVGMGYPRDQVVSLTMKMAESGQPMDFNALLDRLNGATGPAPRAWSG